MERDHDAPTPEELDAHNRRQIAIINSLAPKIRDIIGQNASDLEVELFFVVYGGAEQFRTIHDDKNVWYTAENKRVHIRELELIDPERAHQMLLEQYLQFNEGADWLESARVTYSSTP